MKEIVTFLEGVLVGWIAAWLAGWLTGWQAGAHFCHLSLLILRFSRIGIKILKIGKDV